MKLRSILWLGLDRFFNTPARRWAARIGFWCVFLLVGFPWLLSRVITEPPLLPMTRSTPAVLHLKYEAFSIESFDGTKIAGWWVPVSDPKSEAAPSVVEGHSKGDRKPVILFAHGLGPSKADYMENAVLAHRLGFSCCLIDLRNHGESGRKFVTLGADESRDIKRVMEWLRKEKHATGFVLWGVSLGAASCLLAAVDEPDVDGIMLEACYESMPGTVRRHRKLFFPWVPEFPFVPLTLAWFQLRTGVDPDDVDLVRAASQLKRGRLLLMVGARDARAPVEANQLVLDASGIPAEMWVMPGVDHDHLGGHPEYENRVENFLIEVTEQKQRGRESERRRNIETEKQRGSK